LNDEVYAFTLKSTLQEIQNVSPDVLNTFIFKEGKILAKDETTSEKTINCAMEAFESIRERADVIGSLEALTIENDSTQVNISCINGFHFATISSKKAEKRYVNTLPRILIPTVIKISEKIDLTYQDGAALTTINS
jgi:hypothetical protein